jgi:hypothetical protein
MTVVVQLRATDSDRGAICRNLRIIDMVILHR